MRTRTITTRDDLVDEMDRLSADNERLRARERKIIDQTWGEALEDGSVPSTKLQDKIIAAVDALEQSVKPAKED